jgi:hypothetical protein
MTSTEFNKATNAVNAQESTIVAIQIDHSDLVTPIRVVNDKNDIVINGDTYTACGFSITLPDQPQSGLPSGQLTLDNVNKELMFWLEESNGARGATCTFLIVRRSDPDTVESQMTLFFQSITATQPSIQGDLTLDDIFNRAAMPLIYRPSTAPGLF